MSVQIHPPESDENVQTTLKKGGRNPPDVTLSQIVNELLWFFNRFECLHDAKKEIEKKYDVKKDHSDCWSFDDIKRAWGKTQRMDLKSNRRKHWAHVILLQVIKIRLCYYECKRKSVPSDPIEGEDLAQSCAESSLSRSSEKVEADLEYVSCKAEDDAWLTDGKKTCGTEQSMTVNTQDRSTQSAAELNKKKKKKKNPATKPVYIRIPFSEMFDKESPSSAKLDQNTRSLYKLIDRVPLYAKNYIRQRKSYIMSYNTETNNADWVYEILNESTLEIKCKEHMSFGKNELENKDCNQGHLAAAANHRWCQEAYHDTFLMSNMIPQNKSLNEGMWSTLEQYCRDFVKDDSVRNVHVYTGPLYLKKEKKKYHSVKAESNQINPLKVKAVPTHFFKVVIVEKKDGRVEEPECYVMPNEKLEHEEKLEKDKGSNKEAKIGNKELLKNFKVNIDKFDKEYPFTFIERDTKFDVQLKKTVELTGEDGNGQLHSFNIDVILTPPDT